MTATTSAISLLVFEAADCLMAIPASEIARLKSSPTDVSRLEVSDPLFAEVENRTAFDLGEYFSGRESDGPWLRWGRGSRSAWLRVRRVVDVVPVALSVLTPMPALFRRQLRTRAFLAAGVRGDDVFLLLDPARLTS